MANGMWDEMQPVLSGLGSVIGKSLKILDDTIAKSGVLVTAASFKEILVNGLDTMKKTDPVITKCIDAYV